MPEALGIGTSIDCAAVQCGGPAATGERIAAQLAGPPGRFWLSIDVDVLSSAAMPATPVQQDGGLSLDELAELAAAARAPPGLRRARPALLRRRHGRRRAHERPRGWSSCSRACSTGCRSMRRPERRARARARAPGAARGRDHRDGLAAAVGLRPASFPLAGPVSGESTLEDWLARRRRRVRWSDTALRRAQRRRRRGLVELSRHRARRRPHRDRAHLVRRAVARHVA